MHTRKPEELTDLTIEDIEKDIENPDPVLDLLRQVSESEGGELYMESDIAVDLMQKARSAGIDNLTIDLHPEDLQFARIRKVCDDCGE